MLNRRTLRIKIMQMLFALEQCREANYLLGLDSIDALELALAISKVYGFQLRSEDKDNLRVFASLRALSQHVAQERTR